VTTLSISVFSPDGEDGVRTLRAVAEAYERAGVG
jgi:hypothetical protein